jgi:hypothetical protein
MVFVNAEYYEPFPAKKGGVKKDLRITPTVVSNDPFTGSCLSTPWGTETDLANSMKFTAGMPKKPLNHTRKWSPIDQNPELPNIDEHRRFISCFKNDYRGYKLRAQQTQSELLRNQKKACLTLSSPKNVSRSDGRSGTDEYEDDDINLAAILKAHSTTNKEKKQREYAQSETKLHKYVEQKSTVTKELNSPFK